MPQHLKTGDTSPTGALVGLRGKEKIFAPSHVHNFLFRLNFDVDGEKNTVEEFNWEKDPGNPSKARCSWTPIKKETGRLANPETFRSWRVVNYESKNSLGHPRSYQLIPGSTGMFRGNKSEKSTHADLWVTLEKPANFPGSTDGESVENKDVVLWYWLCFHHFPRSEDWRHQPMVWRSFELIPRDFLDASPLKPEK
jgi:primary-amine oxidase